MTSSKLLVETNQVKQRTIVCPLLSVGKEMEKEMATHSNGKGNWRRKWQPTPVFLPGESQGRGSLGGSNPWGHTESDTTEAT